MVETSGSKTFVMNEITVHKKTSVTTSRTVENPRSRENDDDEHGLQRTRKVHDENALEQRVRDGVSHRGDAPRPSKCPASISEAPEVRDEKDDGTRSDRPRGRREIRTEVGAEEGIEDDDREVDPDERRQRNEPVEHDVGPKFPQDLSGLGECEGQEDQRNLE